MISYLGDLAAEERLGVAHAAGARPDRQPALFDDTPPVWVDVDLRSLRVERTAAFGGVWLGR